MTDDEELNGKEDIIEETPEELESEYPELNVDEVSITELDEREEDESVVNQHRSLSQEEEGAVNKDPLAIIIGHLHQQYDDKKFNEKMQSAAGGRTYPDNVQDKNAINVMSMILEHEPDEAFDVIGLVSMVQDAISRGIEGKQRIEDLGLAGVAHDEEMEKLSKQLGI